MPNFETIKKAILRMRQAARDDRLKVWARMPAREAMNGILEVDETKLFEPVNPVHWSTYSIDELQMGWNPEQIYTALSPWSCLDDKSVCSIKVSKKQVEELFGQKPQQN